ncbi:MAG: acetate--CoA ligase family protein, partial [Gammaproteobacteria bacterium]|nr:acetate--CoA ligase family protein [Gammaproteobacteria bacterium]
MVYHPDNVRSILDQVKADGRTSLTAPECKVVCDAYSIPLPPEGLANSADEAVEIAGRIGYPVALKIVSPDILHKTEAGGVLTGISSADEVMSGYDLVIANAHAYKSDAVITGVQIQKMLSADDALEVIVGAVT